MSVDISNWNSHPFSVDGVNFVSRINPQSSMAKRVSSVPAEVFAEMNVGCIREFLGDVKTLTRTEIQSKLEEANEGFQSAFLALAE